MPHSKSYEQVLVLAPLGRDAFVASQILGEAQIPTEICRDLPMLLTALEAGAGAAVITDDVVRTADIRALSKWIDTQPPWSDFPIVLLTERGGGLERNPSAARQTEALGNVTFVERPLHPTTLVSVVRTALRGRYRQYDARARLEDLHQSEQRARQGELEVRSLNEKLEVRVAERTSELGAANRQLMSQIEERERVEATLRQMQRLEAIGQLTSGVAHDFNNLLTVVLGNIEFIEKKISDMPDSKLSQRVSHMRTAAERGAKLTSQLLAFSRRQNLQPEIIDVNDALGRMRDLLQSSLGGSIQINTILRSDLWSALIDPTQIELVVLNLALNARDAMKVGGSITLETANVTTGKPERLEEPPAGEYVVISVTDKGSGMTKDVLEKAFEPFFTTKEIGKGSGLGLSQVLGFAKQSGGGMRIDSRVAEGTCVKLFLPRAVKGEPIEKRTETELALPHRKGSVILLVDDDSAVREITASILRDLEYVVLEVGSGGAALDLLADGQAGVELVLLDYAMPGMNGMDVARQLQTRIPDVPILFITGYADKAALDEIGVSRIIKKPFVGSELAWKVHKALEIGSKRSSGNVVTLRR